MSSVALRVPSRLRWPRCSGLTRGLHSLDCSWGRELLSTPQDLQSTKTPQLV